MLRRGIGRGDSQSAENSLDRRRLLALTAVGGAAVGTLSALGDEAEAIAAARPSPAQDVRILNFALLLEYLQAAFYRAALDRGVLRGEARELAGVIGAQEQAHVDFLGTALGRKAQARPSMSFEETTRTQRDFLRAAVILEDVGVAAYNGQAANLTKSALDPALKIVSVEGRHAAWVRDVAGEHPAPLAADAGLSAQRVTETLRRAGLLS